MERQERFERLRRTRPRGERSAAIERLERLERLEQAPFYGGHTIKRARVCICLMRLVNCCILSLELLNYHPVRGKTAST